MMRGGISKDAVIFFAGLVILALLHWKKDCVTSSISFSGFADPGPNVQPPPGVVY